MAAHTDARIETRLSDEAIVKYRFVRCGSDANHFALAEAAERTVGISMNTTTASAQLQEVAKQGGGAKLELGGTVLAGQYIKPTTAGKGIKAAAEGDEVGAQAMQDGESGDIIAVEVVQFTAHAAEA